MANVRRDTVRLSSGRAVESVVSNQVFFRYAYGAGFGGHSFGAGDAGAGSVFVVVFVFVAQKHVSAHFVTVASDYRIRAQKSPQSLGLINN